MKYYRVRAKCGHVGGRKNYIEIDFYTIAENGAEAARFVRMAPRVKHHQKDAIRFVEEITAEEYLIGCEEYKADPYTRCKNKQEQDAYAHLISGRIRVEEAYLNFSPEEEKKPNKKRALRYGYLSNKKITKNQFQALWDTEFAY